MAANGAVRRVVRRAPREAKSEDRHSDGNGCGAGRRPLLGGANPHSRGDTHTTPGRCVGYTTNCPPLDSRRAHFGVYNNIQYVR